MLLRSLAVLAKRRARGDRLSITYTGDSPRGLAGLGDAARAVTRQHRGVLYRVVVTGDLSSRFEGILEGVTVESAGETTTLCAELGRAGDLDDLLERLGDLGIEVVSLTQGGA